MHMRTHAYMRSITRGGVDKHAPGPDRPASVLAGAAECTSCPAGTYSNAGASRCVCCAAPFSPPSLACVCMHAYACVHIHAYQCRVHASAHVWVCARVHVCVCVHNVCVHVCTGAKSRDTYTCACEFALSRASRCVCCAAPFSPPSLACVCMHAYACVHIHAYQCRVHASAHVWVCARVHVCVCVHNVCVHVCTGAKSRDTYTCACDVALSRAMLIVAMTAQRKHALTV